MNITSYIHDIEEAISKATNIGLIELEAKFHNIKVIQYKHVEHELNQLNYRSEKLVTEDHIFNVVHDGIKSSDRYTKSPSGKLILVRKDRLWFEKDNDKDVLYAVSSELDGDHVGVIPRNANLIRSKDRATYYSHDGVVKFDLTEVTTLHNKYQPRINSEIEVELLKDINIENLEILNNYVNMISKFMKQSYLVKDVNAWITPTYILNRAGRTVDSTTFESRNIPKPVPLKKNDCVYGGLIPASCKTDYSVVEQDDPVSYTITPKADGVRMMLAIHKDFGLLLISPKRGLYSYLTLLSDISEINKWHGTIIDCEYLKFEHEPDRIIMFDVISHESTSDIQNLNHIVYNGCKLSTSIRSRLLTLKMFERDINKIDKCRMSIDCKFEVKRFFHLSNTRQSMYDAINACMGLKLDYPVDGWIFTPMNYRYNTIPTFEQRKKIGKNKSLGLLTIPSICKLKPWDQMTIDFKFENGKLLSTMDSDVKLSIEFTGDSSYSFDKDNYDVPDPELDGQILEMRPYICCGKIKLVYMRSRPDKGANLYRVASSIWKDLHKPLTIDSLLGKDFVLLRAHNNTVKKNLIDSYPPMTNLIDIGSGTGGDMFKWENVGRVIAIEPCQSNYEELNRRIIKHKKDNIRTLNVGGEDTEIILDSMNGFLDCSRSLVISSMLSLSFFWKDFEMLNGLRRTIQLVSKKYMEMCDQHERIGGRSNRSVQFMFYTIEGHRTNEVLKFNRDITCKKFGTKIEVCMPRGACGQCEDYGQMVTIRWDDTIVGFQEEYVVWLDKLFEDMKITNVDTQDKIGSHILSSEEKEFSSMYVTGMKVFNVA